MSLKMSLLRALLPPLILSTLLVLAFTLFHQLTLLCYIVGAYALLLAVIVSFRIFTIGSTALIARKKGEPTDNHLYTMLILSLPTMGLFFLSNLISLPDKIENSHLPIFSILFSIQTYLMLILGLPTEVIFTFIFLGGTKLLVRYLAFFGIPAFMEESPDAEEALQAGRDQL